MELNAIYSLVVGFFLTIFLFSSKKHSIYNKWQATFIYSTNRNMNTVIFSLNYDFLCSEIQSNHLTIIKKKQKIFNASLCSACNLICLHKMLLKVAENSLLISISKSYMGYIHIITNTFLFISVFHWPIEFLKFYTFFTISFYFKIQC